jgi:hypothetical protein
MPFRIGTALIAKQLTRAWLFSLSNSPNVVPFSLFKPCVCPASGGHRQMAQKTLAESTLQDFAKPNSEKMPPPTQHGSREFRKF